MGIKRIVKGNRERSMIKEATGKKAKSRCPECGKFTLFKEVKGSYQCLQCEASRKGEN